MILILIGNLFSFLGSICSFLSTKVKTYKMTLIIQSLDATFFALSSLFLKGYSGIIVNCVAIARNISCAFFNLNKYTKIVFIGLTVILGLIFMDKTIYGFLPIIASSYYAFVMLNTNDVYKLKKALMINNLLWLIYSIIILDVVGTIFKILSIISCIKYISKKEKIEDVNK